MTTVIPQSELTRRAVDWINEKCGQAPAGQQRCQIIAEAAMRFNLGPLEVEFLERFFQPNAAGETQS